MYEYYRLSTDFGSIQFEYDGTCLSQIVLSLENCDSVTRPLPELPEIQLIRRYLAGEIDCLRGWPISSQGTEFRQRVWQAIAEIGPGEVKTYGELAQRLKSSPRAVGGACGDNPWPILVPCHRVVGKHTIGGFAHSGASVSIKQWLLEHEMRFSKHHG